MTKTWYRLAVKVQKVICLNFFVFRHLSVVNFPHINQLVLNNKYLSSLTSNFGARHFSTKMTAIETTYDWLEDVSGDKSMTWVKAHNARTLKDKNIEESESYKRTLAILDSKEKIPGIRKIGNFWYNFWQDDNHVRGIWRRIPCKTSSDSNVNFDEYLKDTPAWETVLDLDALGKEDDVSWVWKGSSVLYPTEDRALLHLSPGGSDAVVVREFDLPSKSFIKPEDGGFYVPEAKTSVSWRTRDCIFIGTKFEGHEKNGLTDSGYPRIVKEWKRGTALKEAKMVFEGNQTDVSIHGSRDTWVYSDGTLSTIDWVSVGVTFYTGDHYIIDEKSGELVKLLLPEDVEVSSYWDSLLVRLRKPWQYLGGRFLAGSLLTAKLKDVFEDSKRGGGRGSDEMADLFQPLFEPSPTMSLEDFSCTKNYVILNVLDSLKPHLVRWKYEGKGKWQKETLATKQGKAEAFDTIHLRSVDTDHSDDAFVTVESFTKPSTLYYIPKINEIEEGNNYGTKLKQQPSFFNIDGIETQQHWVTSADGTKVPYFLIGKDLSLDKQEPRTTLLYGYGGFEISFTPFYGGVTGAAWLEKGGIFALANIRGGGEFGPKWHQAAQKKNRPRAYEDFEAVAADLLERKVTSPKLLGCMGGSNGGLLVGNMLVRPGSAERFAAVVCQCPLLDMRRFHKLLAGASWMAEYGDPDKEDEWEEGLKNFSPLHMIEKGATYPKVLFTTSTKDDRVHPGHARKMVAKLQDQCDKTSADNVWYYENIEGGHSGAADNKQRAFMKTLEYQFLWDTLKSD